jgi:predicted LPLAT superfamily acyltransferase
VFLAAGALDGFDVEVVGTQCLDQAIASGRGALLLGAHLGSFEVVSAVGTRRAGVRVAMAMYEGNARKMRSLMEALHPHPATQIIALGHLSTMLQIRDLLDGGCFVGMLADRTPGDEPMRRATVLDAQAALPEGPMRAAAMLRRRVIFMAGLHLGGRRYRVVFAPLADFTDVTPAERDARIGAAIDAYAAQLTQLCREAPCNWFNFYDFWRT